MIAHLFNAPLGESEAAVGVGTVGSSEAIMLAGLAFKRRWQNRRKEEGKPCDSPNIVTGANVQVHKNTLASSPNKISSLLGRELFLNLLIIELNSLCSFEGLLGEICKVL